MKKTIAVALVVFFMLSNIYNTPSYNVSAENINNQITLSYSFDNLAIETTEFDGNDYTQLEIIDEASLLYTSEPGEPRIPFKEARIGIPLGENFESVQVTKDDVVSYSVDFLVEPAQGLVPISYDGEITFDEPKEDIYNSEGSYPNKDYEIATTQSFRGYTIVIMRLYPVKYIPKNDRVDLYKSMNVVVKTSTSDTEDTPDNYRGLQKDLDLFKTMIDNPMTFEAQCFPLNTVSTDETYEFVIITNNNLKNYQGSNSFQDLADEKASVGLNTIIKTVEEIGSTPTKIRDFIKYAYNNWHTDYVLLGGGKIIVPVKTVSIKYSTTHHTTPCDLYYACLDSPAPDGTENCDLIAEVYVGRTLADSATEVSNFVKKTIDYMNTNDDYIKNALWVAESLGFGGVANHGKNMIEQHIGHCEDDGYVTNGLPEGGSEGYDVTRLYDGWSVSTLIDKLNSGNYHLIDQISHGNTYLWAKHMSGGDVKNLKNTNYFFLYSQTCYSAYFIQSGCFAESLTVNSGGPFAIIMNAAYGLQYRDSTDGPNNRFSRCFWNALYGKKQPIFGQAFYTSKQDNLVKIGDTGMAYTYHSVVFLGDPSLVVKGISPQLMYDPCSHDFKNMKKGETNTTTFKIWNYGINEIDYSLSTDCDWVDISPTEGSSSNGKRNIITVTINTAGLSDGVHRGYINIDSDTNQYKFEITVTVGASLAFDPGSYRICLPGDKEKTDYFFIWNGGLDTLYYNLSCDADWLTLYSNSGESTGEHDTIVFRVSSSNLEHGWHESTINIDTNAEDDTFKVRLGVDGPDIPENVEPKNNEIGLGKDVKLSVKVYHHNEKTMDVYFYNASDDSKIGEDTNVASGETATTNWNNLNYGTTYTWYAIADDNDMKTQSEIFSFTTNSPPIFTNTNPPDGLGEVSSGIEKLSVDIIDPDNDSYSWSITTDPDVGSNSGNSNTYSTQDCYVSNLEPSTEYTWTVEAYDGTSGTSKAVYSFTTTENTPPEQPNAVYPANNAQDINIICTLNWTCTDPDQDTLTYTIYFGQSNNPEQITETTENQYTIPYDLELDTNYYWKIRATDKLGATSESTLYSFKTSPYPYPGWPDPGSIDITFTRRFFVLGKVKADLKNVGVRDASNVNWAIKITGGRLNRINITKEGTIALLNKNDENEISSHKFLEPKTKAFGIGEVDIKVTISNNDEIVSTKTREAHIFGPVILISK